jgi:hypothetical protein
MYSCIAVTCSSDHLLDLQLFSGLAKFNLLPELLSNAKNGDPTLPKVTYTAGADLPTVKHVKAFAGVSSNTNKHQALTLVCSSVRIICTKEQKTSLTGYVRMPPLLHQDSAV